jgi:hypothetical protein
MKNHGFLNKKSRKSTDSLIFDFFYQGGDDPFAESDFVSFYALLRSPDLPGVETKLP